MEPPADRRGIAGEIEPFLARRHRHHRDDFLDHLPQAERYMLQLDRARLDLGDVEQVVDQDQQAVGAGLQRADEFALTIGQRLRTGQYGRQADDGVHRRANFVRHIGQELGLGDIGRFGGVARVHQRVLGLALLGAVAGDDDITAQLAGIVVHGRQGAVDEEDVAILAHVKAFGGRAAVDGDIVQRLAQGIEFAIGDRLHEISETPDDLVRSVAVDSLGAGVPQHDAPLGIQRDDAVVERAFQDQAEIGLAVGQLQRRRLAFGYVLDDADQAERIACGVALEFGAAVDPADFAVALSTDAVFGFDRRGARGAVLRRRLRDPVLFQDQFRRFREGQGRGRRHTENGAEFFGDDDLVATFGNGKHADAAGLLGQAQLFVDLAQRFVGDVLHAGQGRIGFQPLGDVEEGADGAGDGAVLQDRLDAILDRQAAAVATQKVFVNDVGAQAGPGRLKHRPVFANLQEIAYVTAGQVFGCVVAQQGDA